MNYKLLLLLSILLSGLLISTGCEKEDKNTAPVAAFTIHPESGTIETTFTFDASSSSDEQDEPSAIQIRWDWESDGIFDSDFSVNKILTHQFTQPGTYHITLEVWDSKQTGNVISKTVEVTGTLPVVEIGPVTNIMANSAHCSGSASTYAGSEISDRGFCYSHLPDPTISDDHTSDGTGPGNFESILAGLEKNTKYYVKAYATNDIGTAYSDTVSFTTPDVWICGESLTISHVSGMVAPVSKTVAYQTANGITGEESLCWITSNLGADHQATAVDDATEASSGWYWQFNRKQGYYHDGTTRLPSTSWISDITEDTDWESANDPCALELGMGWRIPLQSEIWNLDQWEDWTGPWNSPLKLHAAGGLDNITGETFNRGVYGYFWSNLQGDLNTGWYYRISVDASVCKGNFKSFALSVRCVKE